MKENVRGEKFKDLKWQERKFNEKKVFIKNS